MTLSQLFNQRFGAALMLLSSMGGMGCTAGVADSASDEDTQLKHLDRDFTVELFCKKKLSDGSSVLFDGGLKRKGSEFDFFGNTNTVAVRTGEPSVDRNNAYAMTTQQPLNPGAKMVLRGVGTMTSKATQTWVKDLQVTKEITTEAGGHFTEVVFSDPENQHALRADNDTLKGFVDLSFTSEIELKTTIYENGTRTSTEQHLFTAPAVLRMDGCTFEYK